MPFVCLKQDELLGIQNSSVSRELIPYLAKKKNIPRTCINKIP